MPIKRGQYRIPNTPLEDRICPYSPFKIASEIHFLQNVVNTHLKETVHSIQLINCTQTLTACEDILIFTLNYDGGAILTEIAKLIHSNMP